MMLHNQSLSIVWFFILNFNLVDVSSFIRYTYLTMQIKSKTCDAHINKSVYFIVTSLHESYKGVSRANRIQWLI